MAFFGILLFIALVVVSICGIGLLYMELLHGQRSEYTPMCFIAFGVISLIFALIAKNGSMGFYGAIALAIGIVWYLMYKFNEESGAHDRARALERQQIEYERQQAYASQQSSNPWAIRYMTSPCPYCGHYKVRYAKWEDKKLSVAFWGIASDKIGKNYKCEHCQRMWE